MTDEQALKDAVVEASLDANARGWSSSARYAFNAAVEALHSFRTPKAEPEVAPRCEPPEWANGEYWHWLVTEKGVRVPHEWSGNEWYYTRAGCWKDPETVAEDGWRWHSVAKPTPEAEVTKVEASETARADYRSTDEACEDHHQPILAVDKYVAQAIVATWSRHGGDILDIRYGNSDLTNVKVEGNVDFTAIARVAIAALSQFSLPKAEAPRLKVVDIALLGEKLTLDGADPTDLLDFARSIESKARGES